MGEEVKKGIMHDTLIFASIARNFVLLINLSNFGHISICN